MAQWGNMQAVNYGTELGEIHDMAAMLRGNGSTLQSMESYSMMGMENIDLPAASLCIGADLMQSALHFFDGDFLDVANYGVMEDQWF